jgi:hypothetical protein
MRGQGLTTGGGWGGVRSGAGEWGASGHLARVGDMWVQGGIFSFCEKLTWPLTDEN